MKISFLVTYYNQKNYVRQSLDSILAIEKPCDWEILVGDDGSSDGTTEIVREYMDRFPENIFLYVMDRTPGKKYDIVRRASANRLNLVDHMTGDYFCIFDGDDCYCHTTFVSQALTLFHTTPGLSVVAFGYQRFSEKRGILSRHVLPAGLLDTTHYLQTGMYTHAGACVYKNIFTPEGRAFLHTVAYYDDNDIPIYNLNFGSMYGVEDVIYGYRQTDNSTFNAMDFAERAVLNAQGHDVDCLLLPQQRRALERRNILSLLWVYYLRSHLKQLLGAEKWQRYLDGCRQLPESVTLLLLNADNNTPSDKKTIRRLLLPFVIKHPKTALGECLRCLKFRRSS